MPEYPIIRHVGLDGLLVTFAGQMSDAGNIAALAFHSEIERLAWPKILESSPTLVSVFLRVDPVDSDLDAVKKQLDTLLKAHDWMSAPLPQNRTIWAIPTVFGGQRAPQLEEAASLAGCTAEEAIADFTSTQVRALTLGFAPGQPYLGLLPDRWNIPRQTALTREVPQGSLVIAVQQYCLFGTNSPTGWRHIGQTAFHTYQPDQATPFPLKPGDELRFVSITESDLEALERTGDPMGGATASRLS